MTVEYNEYGELTMGGTSLKTVAQSFGTPTIVYDEEQIEIKCVVIIKHFNKVIKI